MKSHEWIEHHTSIPNSLLFVCYRCNSWVQGFPIPNKDKSKIFAIDEYSTLRGPYETQYSTDCDEELAIRLLEE